MARDETSPIFEIHAGPRAIKVWANGKVTGFDSNGAPCTVINRIPAAIAEARASLSDTIAIAVITSTAGGWLRDVGSMQEVARRAYAMARVMLEERAKDS